MSGRPVTPLVTVDVIIEVPGGVVLIERKHPPHGWALPGGFVDVGESLAEAARREAREETSLDVELTEQFFTYSDPKRDPRGHTVSVVFLGRISPTADAAGATPVAADDAGALAVHAPESPPPMAFDHGQILEDYLTYRRSGRRPEANR